MRDIFAFRFLFCHSEKCFVGARSETLAYTYKREPKAWGVDMLPDSKAFLGFIITRHEDEKKSIFGAREREKRRIEEKL